MQNISEVLFFSEQLTQGQKVRISRIAKRWTQCDLAYEADVTQGIVSAMERDMHVHPSARKRILIALGLAEGSADGR